MNHDSHEFFLEFSTVANNSDWSEFIYTNCDFLRSVEKKLEKNEVW
jgi:hypothetical protein